MGLFSSSSKSRSSGSERSSWGLGSLLHKCKKACKKACKTAAATVAETIAAPVLRHVTKKIIRRIDEATRAITPVAYGAISFPVQHVVLPAARAITVPVIYVSTPVVRKSTAFIDKVNSWAFRKIAKPLYKRAVVPMLRRLRPPFIEKVIFPAIQKVAKALDRALVRPIAQGVVQPINRDIFGFAAQKIMERVARDYGQSLGNGKSSLKQEMGDRRDEDEVDPTPKFLNPPPSPSKNVRFKLPVVKGPLGQDLVHLVLEKFGVEPETRVSSIFTDFVLSSSAEDRPASFALLCKRCQNHRFHSGAEASTDIPPIYCTVRDLLESIKGSCRLCSLVHETLSLPRDGSSPDKKVSVETWVEPGRPDSGLGYISRIKVSTEEKNGYKGRFLSFMSHVPHDADNVACLLKGYLSPNGNNTDTSVSLDFLSVWQKTCKESHEHCNNRLMGDPIKNASFKIKAPFRLVDIIEEKIEENPDETHEYVALSYTWGDLSPESKKLQKPTLKDNIQGRTYTHGLAAVLGSETLPAVYKDTIQLAKRLGYRYIWVDVWCNVQDDNVDLEGQISNMGYIFQSADLTIGAGIGRAVKSSLFSRQRASTPPFLIHTTLDGKKRPVIISRQLDQSPSVLDTRLWVFQEQLLSRRTVEFGPSYTTWRCTQGTAASLPVSQPQPSEEGDALEIDTSTSKLRAFVRGAAGLSHDVHFEFDHEFAAAWYSAVRNYTKRSWSVRQDQIPALVGVASVIARQTGWNHLAGLWKEDMPYGLTWYRNKEPAREDVLSSMAHDADCAPTWSWAARANGPVSFRARADVQRNLAKLVRSKWVWPAKQEAQRRLVLAGEVVDAKCGTICDDDWDWIHKVDSNNIAPIVIDGVRAGYAMLDAPMDLKKISILPLFALRSDCESGPWGVGLALTRIIQGSSCWYKRVGLVVLSKKVGTDYDFTEFDEDDDEHKIVIA